MSGQKPLDAAAVEAARIHAQSLLDAVDSEQHKPDRRDVRDLAGDVLALVATIAAEREDLGALVEGHTRGTVRIRGTDEETGSACTREIEVAREVWRGQPLILVTVRRDGDDPLPQKTQSIYLATGAALRLATAIRARVPHETEEIDTIEPWAHTAEPISEARFARIVDALTDDPRASSRGHKRTLRACRALADEVLRLREACAKRARAAVEFYGDDPQAVSVVVGLGLDISPQCLRGRDVEMTTGPCECAVCKAIRAQGDVS